MNFPSLKLREVAHAGCFIYQTMHVRPQPEATVSPTMNSVAVTCGRIVISFVGSVFIAASLAFLIVQEGEQMMLWLLLFVGIILLLLAYVLPSVIAAQFGFSLPLLVPNKRPQPSATDTDEVDGDD